MDAFKSLMVYDKNNPYSEYAVYYYALSGYNLGYLSLAKEMFKQLKQLYPDWSQMDEVNYMLAKIYFDENEVFQALVLADQISDPTFTNDIKNLKKVHVSKIEDIETLRMLLEEHPEDVLIAKILVKRLGVQPFHLQDTTFINSLLTKFNFSRDELIAEVRPLPILKEKYKIALIMPFLASTLDPSPVKKKNQFVLELYEGMKQAADTLKYSGINLELLAYDNERNLNLTKKILREEELKYVDLIVGPLFQEESVPVQEFSSINKIGLVVNPLSNNAEFSNLSPSSFLFQPSYETIGAKAAEFASLNARNKNCFVYYGESSKDSTMAANFVVKATELNLNIVKAIEVNNETSGSILSTLTTATDFDEWKNPLQFKLKKDSIGCIFVASSNELIYSKVINAAETRGDSILVIGHEEWLENSTIDYSKYERVGVTMASPNFSRFDTPAYQEFRMSYLQKHGMLPTDYSSIGYEFIMIMGKILSENGINFLYTMNPGQHVDGTLTDGFTLSGNRDNESLIFTRFKDGVLSKVNQAP
jgi:ABC-type branched-subunit amino acid transport system substrate-binding protein